MTLDARRFLLHQPRALENAVSREFNEIFTVALSGAAPFNRTFTPSV